MNYRRVFIKNGLVFLTIVTNDRIPILTDNIKLLNQSYNNVIKYYNVGLVNPTYKRLWQNRYWEHTIRDENDLNIHLNYIHYNPVKHGYAKSVKDWEYSSFHKFVKKGLYDINWGSNTDIKEIIDLDFE